MMEAVEGLMVQVFGYDDILDVGTDIRLAKLIQIYLYKSNLL
jgi:hypothetical protein